jgi:hypothetical protein
MMHPHQQNVLSENLVTDIGEHGKRFLNLITAWIEGGGEVVHVILPARMSHAIDKLRCLE